MPRYTPRLSMISCRYGRDADSTGKLVVYLLATLLPDW